jgi:hypothetical protein
MNAVLTIRPVVGKGADGTSNELMTIARSLQADTLQHGAAPRRSLVR